MTKESFRTILYWTLILTLTVAYVLKPVHPITIQENPEVVVVQQDCSMAIEEAVRQEQAFNKIIKLRPKIDQPTAREIATAVAQVSVENDIDLNLLLAIAWTESSLNPDARGSAGEYGLFQVMPAWAEELSFVDHPEELQEIQNNVRAGGHIYTTYYKKFGTKRLALTAYNRGGLNVSNDLRIGENPENGYATLVLARYDIVRRY